MTVIEERTVGPGLGADSIRAGAIASMIAGVLVVVFMLVAYGFLGVIANIALAANVAMVIAVLSLLGATLTLPGIAGIVLTVGMAVDSNVLIYERVREERLAGQELHPVDGSGLFPRAGDDCRLQPDDLHRRRRAVLSRLRPGQGFCRHARHRHHHHRLHRLHADALDGGDLDQAAASQRKSRRALCAWCRT